MAVRPGHSFRLTFRERLSQHPLGRNGRIRYHIRLDKVFRPSRATADRVACGRGAPQESAGAGGAPYRRPHTGSALTECAGRGMPPPLAEPACGGGMTGDGLAPDGNLAIAERGEDAARRPPPRAGEVAAAFPAPRHANTHHARIHHRHHKLTHHAWTRNSLTHHVLWRSTTPTRGG